MKISLQVDGRGITLPEQEQQKLVAIVKEYFANKAAVEEKVVEVAKRPQEGKCFEVKPGEIDYELFCKRRYDKRQEETRHLILDAFEMAEKFPKSYGKPFQTMMPEKTWTSKTVEELIGLASRLGNHNADWVEQALEWAQRIQNGETWEEVCNEPDTANWYRLVIWKDEDARLVGGSRRDDSSLPGSVVVSFDYVPYDYIDSAVPLVVL